MSDVCSCGHVLDEHASSPLAPCNVGGCGCNAFEALEDDEDER